METFCNNVMFICTTINDHAGHQSYSVLGLDAMHDIALYNLQV